MIYSIAQLDLELKYSPSYKSFQGMVHVIKNRLLKGPLFLKIPVEILFPFQSVVAAKENNKNIDRDMQVKN